MFETDEDADELEDVDLEAVEDSDEPDDEGEEEEDFEDDDDDSSSSASLDELLAQRAAARRASGDGADDDDIMSLASESDDAVREPVVPRVVPLKQRQEFVCNSCRLVKAKSQLADPQRGLCRDCV